MQFPEKPEKNTEQSCELKEMKLNRYSCLNYCLVCVISGGVSPLLVLRECSRNQLKMYFAVSQQPGCHGHGGCRADVGSIETIIEDLKKAL